MSEIPEDVQSIADRIVWGDLPMGDLKTAICEAILAERERCAAIMPEPDIEGPSYGFGPEAFASGYSTGFWDCHERFVAAIRASHEP